MIELEHVTVQKDGHRIIEDISLTLSRKRTGVIGANGSGKSTFVKLLNGLEAGFSGKVSVDGVDVSQRNALGRVGFVFQNPDNQIVFPMVYEDLAFGLKKSGLSKAEVKDRIEQYLDIFDLLPAVDRRTHELSGGEKQIIALIGVLVMAPDYIVFDEPTTLLDLRNRHRLVAILEQLHQSLIVVSHDLELMRTMDELVWIDGGRIRQHGDPAAVLAHYVQAAEETDAD